MDEFIRAGQSCFYRLLARNEAGASPPSKVVGPVKMRCATLVDELRNTSLIYRSRGSLELKSNNARNFKEDCHRLQSTNGVWFAYQVTGSIKAMRVYAFGEKEAPRLEFYAGADGSKGAKLEARAEDFNGSKDMYDFRWPRLYRVSAPGGKVSEISILFANDTQIGRVELEYE